jgi:hypothetical protein
MLATLTFGDLKSRLWGACWDLDGAGFALLSGAPTAARLDASRPGEPWRLLGADIDLEAVGQGEPGEVDGGFEQLVTVRGRCTIEGTQHDLETLGRRGTRSFEADRFETIRDVSAWFGPDLGMAVVAARPRGCAGHEHDAVSAWVLDDGRSLRVADPRLSTTYTASGSPVRTSFELWLEDADEGEPGAEEESSAARFPRRAGGEAVGLGAEVSGGGLHAHAELFRWHARGREGAGVYVLARIGA